MADNHLNTPEEVWKAIPGFEGYYDVSDQGRVRSYWRQSSLGRGKGAMYVLENSPQKILRFSLSGTVGYPAVNLATGHSKESFLVSRLVLLAFRGPCPPGMEACHNDGIPTKCSLTNLRWDTRNNNNLDRVKHGKGAVGENNPNAKLTKEKVLNIRELHSKGISCIELEKLLSISYFHLRLIVTRKLWKHI